jgi:hypothetical protein
MCFGRVQQSAIADIAIWNIVLKISLSFSPGSIDKDICKTMFQIAASEMADR